jgi:hypothetical protein
MRGSAARPASLLFGLIFLLGGCGHQQPDSDPSRTINVLPTNYKSDILGAMHAYLDDPTGIRDAAIGEPALKTIGDATRYVVCLKLNAKKNGSKEYAGTKEMVAAFFGGRFDQFIENNSKNINIKDICGGVTYAPFPELQKLPP